jgi:hypothetical protein
VVDDDATDSTKAEGQQKTDDVLGIHDKSPFKNVLKLSYNDHLHRYYSTDYGNLSIGFVQLN